MHGSLLASLLACCLPAQDVSKAETFCPRTSIIAAPEALQQSPVMQEKACC